MIPIELLRVRIGLDPTDTSKDAQLELADAMVTAMLEAWLNRRLPLAQDAETFTHFSGDVISLRRYPLVEGSVGMSGLDGSAEHHADLETGLIKFDERLHEHEFTVSYEGGYAELPPALLGAALLVFDSVWAVLGGGAGAAPGTLRSITIPDVGTMQYATATDGGSSITGLASDGVPAAFAGILERYRRWSV